MQKILLKLQAAMPYLFAISIIFTTFLMLIELAHSQGGWPYWDKVQHILVFMALAILGIAGFSKKVAWVCAGLMIYGAGIEYLQGILTISRLASVGDWLADIVGIMLATFIWLMSQKYLANRNVVLI